MNVVHLIDSEGMFGAEYVVLNLLIALKRIGISVSLCCLSPINSPGADLGRALEKEQISVILY